MSNEALNTILSQYVNNLCARWIDKHQAAKLRPPLAKFSCGGLRFPSYLDGQWDEDEWILHQCTLTQTRSPNAKDTFPTLGAQRVHDAVRAILRHLLRQAASDDTRLLFLTPTPIQAYLTHGDSAKWTLTLSAYYGVQHTPPNTGKR